MQVYSEDNLRKNADAPTIRMLDLWHELCKEKLSFSIEVTVGNRREHPMFSAYGAELHTAYPMTVNGKFSLVVLIDYSAKWKPLMITHELGHWVLKMQGARALLYNVNHHSRSEALLASISQHPSLYALQKNLGHDPQKEIDMHAGQTIVHLGQTSEPIDELTIIEQALYISDDLINCSKSNKTGLTRVISKKRPKTQQIVNKILMVAQANNNLALPQDCLPFCKMVVKEVPMQDDWSELDEVSLLKEHNSELGEK
jgi:hypothetical protein